MLGVSGSYYKVKAAGKTGYVPKSHVSVTSGKVPAGTAKRIAVGKAKGFTYVYASGSTSSRKVLPLGKGNMVDMATGIIIGGAFGTIVNSLVNDILMPPIGLVLGGVDFSNLAITLKEASVDAAGEAVPAVVIGYGEFINALIQFIIVAFAIFMVVKAINRMSRKQEEPAAPEAPPEDVLLLREIRDSLKR